MKLSIKKKYFDLIKSGGKDLEWRDAHITFVCQETGETLKKEVTSVHIEEKKNIAWDLDKFTKEDLKELFEDDDLIGFALK